MAMVQGVRTTDVVGSSLAKRDVYETIFNIDPYQTPITQFALAGKIAKRKVGNYKFEWMEDLLVSHTDSATVATTTLTATDYTKYKLGSLVLFPSTNQTMRVTATPSTTSVTVARADSASAITTVSTAETVLIFTDSYAEGSAAAVAISTQATFPYNYTQILKKAVAMSGTQMAMVDYGGSDWTNQRIKATKEFKLAIERMGIYGHRYQTATAGAYLNYSGGLMDATIGITNTSQYTGYAAFADETYFFNTYLKNLFAKGSGRKRLYMGSDALMTVNDYSKIKVQTTPAEKIYGVNVRTIIVPWGEAELIWQPMLEQWYYPSYCLGIDADPDYLKYAYLSGNGENRDMQYQTDVGTNGVDGRTDQYLAEIAWQFSCGSQGVHRMCYPGA